MAFGDAADSDTKINMELHALLPKKRKTSQYLLDESKFRKISMSTNLPDSSLFHDPSSLGSSNNNLGLEDDKIVASNKKYQDSSKPPINLLHKDNLKHRKSDFSDSLLKRSDAVDLLSEVASNQSFNSDEQFKMISLPRKPVDKESDEVNPKAGNGSFLKNNSKIASADQKITDYDDPDERSKLI